MSVVLMFGGQMPVIKVGRMAVPYKAGFHIRASSMTALHTCSGWESGLASSMKPMLSSSEASQIRLASR
ncbi:hypothetical protein MRB53_002443 [Persea americana]|uniref:Uncharacterized protein n=1 Tax=Persea americana TaxID=3435 RepID=A0ACC2MUJ6_PERAE|nr:hypothetical protein MRB53_002443 [Persea americana]